MFGAASAHACVNADAAGQCASTTRHEAAAEAHPQAGPRCCAPLQSPGRRRCATAGDGHRWRASAGPSVGCHGITRGRVVFAVWEVQRRWQSETCIKDRSHYAARAKPVQGSPKGERPRTSHLHTRAQATPPTHLGCAGRTPISTCACLPARTCQAISGWNSRRTPSRRMSSSS